MFRFILSHEELGEVELGHAKNVFYVYNRKTFVMSVDGVRFEADVVFVEFDNGSTNIYFGHDTMLIVEKVK